MGQQLDEEDDQTSSWVSDPEGENAEELASMKAPDEEGELNGETGDEDMEDGEMGFEDGVHPGHEHQEHMTTHRPHRSWCKFCVMGRGVNAPHRRSDAQDDLDGVPYVSKDHGFLGEGI